jgi:large subunit ribosomal protein L9
VERMNMDIVLLQDVEKLGAEGQVVKVKPGYARNYLLPRGLAVNATPAQVRAAEETKKQRQQKQQRATEDAEAVKRKIESQPLSFTLKIGAEDKAFGSVTAHEIVEALNKSGFGLDKHAVQLAQPIKTLGTFDVPVRVHPSLTATVKVVVAKA